MVNIRGKRTTDYLTIGPVKSGILIGSWGANPKGPRQQVFAAVRWDGRPASARSCSIAICPPKKRWSPSLKALHFKACPSSRRPRPGSPSVSRGSPRHLTSHPKLHGPWLRRLQISCSTWICSHDVSYLPIRKYEMDNLISVYYLFLI